MALSRNDTALYPMAGFKIDGVRTAESDDNNMTQTRSFYV
jgi:hypothetical protein